VKKFSSEWVSCDSRGIYSDSADLNPSSLFLTVAQVGNLCPY